MGEGVSGFGEHEGAERFFGGGGGGLAQDGTAEGLAIDDSLLYASDFVGEGGFGRGGGDGLRVPVLAGIDGFVGFGFGGIAFQDFDFLTELFFLGFGLFLLLLVGGYFLLLLEGYGVAFGAGDFP